MYDHESLLTFVELCEDAWALMGMLRSRWGRVVMWGRGVMWDAWVTWGRFMMSHILKIDHPTRQPPIKLLYTHARASNQMMI